MATIANWNGHTFVVSPSLIRSFTDLKIRGACETTEKNSEKQKYEEKKYGEAYEINMTAELSAQMGVTNVYSEAMRFVHEATMGACGYFYLGSSKLIPAEMMLVKAEVKEIQHLPGSGDVWISALVDLTFKEGTEKDKGAGSGSGGGRVSLSHSGVSTPASFRSPSDGGYRTTSEEEARQRMKNDQTAKNDQLSKGLNDVKDLVEQAKRASLPKEPVTGLEFKKAPAQKATETKDTAVTIKPTTQRMPDQVKMNYVAGY